MASSNGAENDNRDTFYEDIPNESDNQQQQTRINFLRDDFPQPWFPRHDRLEKHYLQELKIFEDVLGRRLTATEQEGVAYWSNRELQIQSRGPIFGFLGGACKCLPSSSPSLVGMTW